MLLVNIPFWNIFIEQIAPLAFVHKSIFSKIAAPIAGGVGGFLLGGPGGALAGFQAGRSLTAGGGGGDDKTNDIQALLQQIAAGGGFTPEQMQLLEQQLAQTLGGQQQQQVNVLKQSTAGQPRAVQTAALASSQNQFRGALQRGTTQIQTAGIDRQFQALIALLQDQQAKQAIKAQNQQSLFSALAAIGGGIAPFVLERAFPRKDET